MRISLSILLILLACNLHAQVYYNGQLSLIPTRTISLNDFGAKGDNSTADATIIKSVFKLADQKGFRVTGSGTFNFNGDSVKLDNIDLWASNKGAFIITNGGFLMPKKTFKAQNVIFNDWTAAGKGVLFWDTVRNSSGVIINDGWPEKNFILQVDNVDFNNVSNAFYCQQDPPKDSSSLYNSYIKNVKVNGFRYSAIKLPFIHYGLALENITIENVTNGGANFSAGINVGIDGVERKYSHGLTINNVKIRNVKADTVTKSTYGILAYTNGAIVNQVQFNEVGGPLYISGDDNQLGFNTLINDSTKSRHGIIIKGGANSYSKLTSVSNNLIRGKFLTAIYVDHRGDKLQLINNQTLVENDPYNVGDGALRILSHGFNSIDISGGSYENQQTNDATNGIMITTDDTIYNVTISNIALISASNGISVNSEMIKSFEVMNNPLLYAATDHTFKTAGTTVRNSTIYYNPAATYAVGLNSSKNIYFINNTFKPYFKGGSGTLGRLFHISNDAATANTYYYFEGNKYDLSSAAVAFYVENPAYFRFRNERLTNTAPGNSNFMNIRFNAGRLDVEANVIDIPYGKSFITTGLGNATDSVKLKVFNSNITGNVIGFTSGTQASIVKDSLWIDNTILGASSSYGSGWKWSKINEHVDFNGTHFLLTDGVVSLKPGVISGGSGVPVYLNVQDFGAVTSSTIESTTAFRAALDSAKRAGGGIVFVPEGFYVTDSLVIPAKVTLMGAGAEASYIKLKEGSTAKGMIYLKGADYGQVRDLTIDGNRSLQTNYTDGIVITNDGSAISQFAKVDRAHIYNFKGNGVYAPMGSAVYEVSNCRIRSNEQYGIYNESFDNAFINNLVVFNDMGGVYSTGNNTRIIGGKVYANGRHKPNSAGIYMQGSRNQVLGVEVQENYYHGIELKSGKGNKIDVTSDMNNVKRRPVADQFSPSKDTQDVNAVGYALKMTFQDGGDIRVNVTSAAAEGTSKYTQYGVFIDSASTDNVLSLPEQIPMFGPDSIAAGSKNTWLVQERTLNVSTDASFTLGRDYNKVVLNSTLTSDQTITIPNANASRHKKIVFVSNGPIGNAFTWKFNQTVGSPNGPTSTIPNNSVVTIESFTNGSVGEWKITSIWEPTRSDDPIVFPGDANYTIASGLGDFTVVYDVNITAARTLALPPAASNKKRKITVKHANDGAFNINLSASVYSSPSTTINTIGPADVLVMVSNGTNWIKIN